MSTTTRIHFDPSLFGEEQISAAPQSPALKVEEKSWGWLMFWLLFGLIGITGGAIALSHASQVSRDSHDRISAAATRTSPILRKIETEPGDRSNTPPIMLTDSSLNRWCDGEETICTTSTTATPAETLQKLIAAIPKGKAKQYKIRLSVTPIQNAEIDDTSR